MVSIHACLKEKTGNVGGNHLGLRCCHLSFLNEGPCSTESLGLKRTPCEVHWDSTLRFLSRRRTSRYLTACFRKPICNVFSIKSTYFPLSLLLSQFRCPTTNLSSPRMALVYFIIFVLVYITICRWIFISLGFPSWGTLPTFALGPQTRIWVRFSPFELPI